MKQDGDDDRQFNYKLLQDRIAPQSSMDSKSLIKCG